MSKASEYARKFKENKPHVFEFGDGTIAKTNVSGSLFMTYCPTIDAETAVAFGKWLIDTFGENE